MKFFLVATLAITTGQSYGIIPYRYAASAANYGYASPTSGYGYPAIGYNYGTNGFAASSYGAIQSDPPSNYDYTAPAYNYGAAYSYPTTPASYTVPRQPQRSCVQRATALWSDFSNRNLYDGRTLSWQLYPVVTTVTNKAEFNNVMDYWDSIISAWKTTVHSSQQSGDTVMYQVNWEGTVSKTTGAVIPVGAPSTFHVFDCSTNVEKLWGDFHGIMVFMQ